MFNKLIPKGITQTIFRRNKNQTQILQDPCESPTLPPIVHANSQASPTKNGRTHGSNNSLNQLTSPSLTSYQSSGYGSQPHSARASLQEQPLPLVGGQTNTITSWMEGSDRRHSVESGCGSSPCFSRRNGVRNSREENAKNTRCHGSKKPIGTLGTHSPRTSQTQYQCPMTITCLKVGRSQETRDHREHSGERTFVVVNSRRYQIAANGAVIKEGAPVLNKKKKMSVSQHKMSLQPRKPSQVILPPISSSRHSVPSGVGPRAHPPASFPVQPAEVVDPVAIVPKVSLSSAAPRTEQRKLSGENSVAIVTHKIPPVPPTTPLLVMNEETDKADTSGNLDPDRPKSRRKNAVVSAEDKPDVNALLAALSLIHI